MNTRIASSFIAVVGLLILTSCRSHQPVANKSMASFVQEKPFPSVVATNTAFSASVGTQETSTVVTNPVPTNVVAYPEPAVLKPQASKLAAIVPGIAPPKPRMFKAKGYPPKTPEEKAMWDWWDAMEKIDLSFQWKMPIEFYGKVVDQFGQPVPEAEVELGWTTVIGLVPDPKKTIFAGADGRFVVNGIRGKVLWVNAHKKGYLPTRNSADGFEYAAFYEDNFHVPDPNRPVVFPLQKLMGSELMYQFELNARMTPSGAPLVLNAAQGKIRDDGEFAFSVRLGEKHDNTGPNYSITLQALKGAGFSRTEEAFPFKAPESGYQTSVTIAQNAADKDYNQVQQFCFYFRTPDGKYGVAWVEFAVSRFRNDVSFNSTVRYNPSGSRNLEFDQNKWINR